MEVSMDVNERKKFVEELGLFVEEKESALLSICKQLGWTEESLMDEDKVQCPHDPNHWVLESSLSEHAEKCSLVKDGYLKEDMEKQPPDSEFFYQKAPSLIPIIIVSNTIFGMKGVMPLDEMPNVPKTVDRSTVDLNREQRLAIYDYVIKESKKGNTSESVILFDLMQDFQKKNDQEDKPKSQLEILAEQRDYKRRRQSYRAKNVEKSYLEKMKEVIEVLPILAGMTKRDTNERYSDSSNGKKDFDSRQGDKSPSARELSQNSYYQESRKKDRSPSERYLHYNDSKYESRKRDRSSISRESSYEDYKYESRKRDKNSSARESSYSDYKDYSRDRRSRSPFHKKKKRKHNHSRSRSRSHKHKKSHKKHKKSHD